MVTQTLAGDERKRALGTPLWYLLREAATQGRPCTVIIQFARSGMTRSLRLSSRQARQVLAGELDLAAVAR